MKKFVLPILLCCILFVTILTCEQSSGDPDYVGTRKAFNTQTDPGPLPVFRDLVVILSGGGSFESLVHELGTSTLTEGSARGIYTAANNVFTMSITEQYSIVPPVGWQVNPQIALTPYTLAGNTLTLFIDLSEPPDGDADLIVALTRQ